MYKNNTEQRGSVRQRGTSGAWYYRFRIRDKYGKWKNIEKKAGYTRREAEEALRLALNEYRDSGFFSDPGEMTVYELCQLWYQKEIEHSSRASNTKYGYRNIIRHIFEHSLGAIKLKNLTIDDLQNYIDEKSYGVYKNGVVVKKAYSESHMHQQHVLLNMVFKFAAHPKNHLLRTNIFEYVEKRKTDDEYDIFGEINEAPKPIISKEAFDIIVNYLGNHSVYHVYVLPLQIALHTGLRPGEIVGLTFNDIDFEKKKIHVRRSMYYDLDTKCWQVKVTKTKKARIIDICDTLFQILKEAKTNKQKNQLKYGPLYHNQYFQSVNTNRSIYRIFTEYSKETKYLGSRVAVGKSLDQADSSKPLSPLQFICSYENGSLMTTQSLKYLNKIIQKKIDYMEDFSMYNLRHSFASLLVEKGAPVSSVSELMGHSTPNTTLSFYTHASPDSNKNTMDILEKSLHG